MCITQVYLHTHMTLQLARKRPFHLYTPTLFQLKVPCFTLVGFAHVEILQSWKLLLSKPLTLSHSPQSHHPKMTVIRAKSESIFFLYSSRHSHPLMIMIIVTLFIIYSIFFWYFFVPQSSKITWEHKLATIPQSTSSYQLWTIYWDYRWGDVTMSSNTPLSDCLVTLLVAVVVFNTHSVILG